MRQLKQHLFIAIVLLAGLAAWSNAMAVEIHGRSSTQYIWYTDIFTDEKQAELAEYLNLSITKIDEEGKITIHGYGRGTYAFEDARDGSDDLKGRLYYLYLDYRDLFNKADLRFGRQYISYAAGSALVDGAQVEIKNIGPVAVVVMGGRNVIFDLYGESSTSDDLVYGAAAYLQGFKRTDAEISYFQKEDVDGTARDQVGGSFKQYLLDSLKVYANARYDLASETFNEALGGVKYFPTSDLVFTGEYYASYPTFDNTSIYSVFAVEHFKEGLVRADYRINEKWSVNGGYTMQDFEGDDADVIEVGLRVRPIESVQLVLNYDRRSGYGGKLNGLIAEGYYDQSQLLQLAAGIHYDVYERDRSTGEETARKYWFGGNYKLAANMSATARIEDNVNARYDNNWQGRVVFDYTF